MSKKKKTAIAALIVLGIVAVGLAAGVYAKYIASFTGTGTAQVAKWDFEDENKNGSVACPLTNYVASTLVNGRIAPGTEGVCTIALTNANSEVGVAYTIKLKNISNQPKNLKFYKTRNGSAGSYTYSDELTTTSGNITGTIGAGDSTGATQSVYWVWPYEDDEAATSGVIVDNQKAGDVDDTTDGKSGETMEFILDIQGVQVRPSSN